MKTTQEKAREYAARRQSETFVDESADASLFASVEEAVETAIQVTGDKTIQLIDFEANAAGILIPEDAADDQVDKLTDVLFAIWDRLSIYIGDVLVKRDNREYGETAKIADRFRRDPDTLYKWKSVCKAVTIFLRRKVYAAVPDAKKPLTMKHYEIVMTLPEERQEQLLTEALRQGWSTAVLQREARMVHVKKSLRIELTDPAHPAHRRRVMAIQRKAKEGRYAEIALDEIALSIDWLEEIQTKATKAQQKK